MPSIVCFSFLIFVYMTAFSSYRLFSLSILWVIYSLRGSQRFWKILCFIWLVGLCIYLNSELSSTMFTKYPIPRFILLMDGDTQVCVSYSYVGWQTPRLWLGLPIYRVHFLQRETALVVDFPLSTCHHFSEASSARRGES